MRLGLLSNMSIDMCACLGRFVFSKALSTFLNISKRLPKQVNVLKRLKRYRAKGWIAHNWFYRFCITLCNQFGLCAVHECLLCFSGGFELHFTDTFKLQDFYFILLSIV